jgi:hypothetical protein
VTSSNDDDAETKGHLASENSRLLAMPQFPWQNEKWLAQKGRAIYSISAAFTPALL